MPPQVVAQSDMPTFKTSDLLKNQLKPEDQLIMSVGESPARGVYDSDGKSTMKMLSEPSRDEFDSARKMLSPPMNNVEEEEAGDEELDAMFIKKPKAGAIRWRKSPALEEPVKVTQPVVQH